MKQCVRHQRTPGARSKPPEAHLPLKESTPYSNRQVYIWPETHWRMVPQCGRVNYKRALPELPSHRHKNAYEICLVREGALCWEILGKPFYLGAGEVLVLAPGAEHGGRSSMMERCLLDFLQISTGGNDLGRLIDCLGSVCHRPWPAGPGVALAFDGVLREAASKDRWSARGMESAVVSLLLAVLRSHAQGESRIGKTFSAPVARAIAHMETHPEIWPTLHELAQVAGLGKTQLQERFRKETGCRINAYAIEQRIVRAKQLLIQGQSGTACALALGFSSSQYFSTIFKRWTGLTPTQFAALPSGGLSSLD